MQTKKNKIHVPPSIKTFGDGKQMWVNGTFQSIRFNIPLLNIEDPLVLVTS